MRPTLRVLEPSLPGRIVDETDTQTDAMSQVTKLSYDTAGRLVGVSFPGTSMTMDYDALGRIVRQVRTLESAPAKVSLRASDQALQHLAHCVDCGSRSFVRVWQSPGRRRS